ncbi:MAG: zinc-dependent alcohol dehydrogenase family protein [Miltoncostaeaceae bacterium]
MVLRHPGPASEDAPLTLEERPAPPPGDGQLAVAVSACGVCRTDLQLAEGDLGARRLPIVPGHQVVGHVSAVGAGCAGWREGDRVGVTWLAGSCGACARCREGRENLCPEARFTGWDVDGGFCESTLVDASVATPVPDRFPDLDAAPLLCGGVVGYRALRLADVPDGGRLGLYGFGASALCVIQVARHRGCEVYVCTRSERERKRARELGATWAGSYDDMPPEPLEAAITFAPVGEVVVAALSAVDRGGRVVVNAIHLDRIPEFSYDRLWWERSLMSVANVTRRDAREFLEIAADIPVRTAVEIHPLERANHALARLQDGAVDGAAVLTMADLGAAPTGS